jgi:alpha-galactosidase
VSRRLLLQALIDINQDPLGKAATTYTPKGQAKATDTKLYKYYYGPLTEGVVVGLVAADGAETLTANFAEVPGLGEGNFAWTELYSGANGTGTSVTAKLANHDMAVYKVVKAT